MKKIFIITIIGILVIGCSKKESIEGFISPGTENKLEWVIGSYGEYIPKETVSVILPNGDTVEACIPEHSPLMGHAIRYRNYPPTIGKRVAVILEKEKDGNYSIVSGR